MVNDIVFFTTLRHHTWFSMADMYRLYDFQVGPKKQPQRSLQSGNMILYVHAPDDEGKFQMLSLGGDDPANSTGKGKTIAADLDEESDALPSESTDTMLVVYIGNDKVVLDKATLNQPNNDGWTVLHACCHTLNAQEAGITILKELVTQKCDLNMVTRRGPGSFSCGWTPLHVACAYGLEALTVKLIRAGANVNVKNSVGWTPLYDACHRGYASVARELLKAGAKYDIICPEFALCPFPGQLALAEAARQGHVDTVKVLLEWGVPLNAVNKLGWTALHEAAYHSRVAIVKLFIVYGADVLVKTDKGSVAKDLTIHSEIRAMLEDIAKHTAPASPSKEKPKKPDTEETQGSSKKSSPTKAQSIHAAPLARKEDYPLLGDLPDLATTSIPSISIQDADREELEEDDGESKDNETKAEVAHSSSSGKTKSKKKHKSGKSKDIPAEYKCSVSLKLLKDPLRSPFGHVFERRVIEAWFRDFGNRCPLSGEPLTMQQLQSDDKLKASIQEWKQGSVKSDAAGASDAKTTVMTGEAKPETPAAIMDDPYAF